MERSLFESRLQIVGQQAVVFAREFVKQALPDAIAFRVYPNQSYDSNPRRGDEVVWPEDTLPAGQFHGPWSVGEATSFLWRDGKVPEWIDVAVVAVEQDRSLIRLTCCGRYSALEELWYHHLSEFPPFSVKGPISPPWWIWNKSKPSKRFHLDWQKRPVSLKVHLTLHRWRRSWARRGRN